MTALKPIESRRVRGVASERYPLNKKCAHPECNEDAVDPHHIWPRSAIGNDSWFVAVQKEGVADFIEDIIPHVTGLCRAHHDDVEEHRSWIKLENGVFVWYDRIIPDGGEMGDDGWEVVPEAWITIDPLNPQPGSVEGKPKRRKFKGEARRKRKTISIKVPQDAQEDGAGIFMDLVEQLEAKRVNDESTRPVYYTLIEALAFTLLNADSNDF